METWQAMAVATVLVVSVGVVVSVANVALPSPAILGVILLAVGVFYLVAKRGYRMGQDIGRALREDD